MSEEQVPLVRTVPSTVDYARACMRAWKLLLGVWPTQAQVGVLYAQWIVETGGRHCWNWNVGNVKHIEGDGFDWVDLPGTWELIDGKRVVMPEGDPGRHFRAYATLDAAMTEHLGFLRKRFALCWPKVEAGDPEGFAHALKAGRDGIEGTRDDYFTGSVTDYARIMRNAHDWWMRSDAFERANAEIERDANRDTDPEGIRLDHEPEDTPLPIIHPLVPLGRPSLDGDDEPPDEAA